MFPHPMNFGDSGLANTVFATDQRGKPRCSRVLSEASSGGITARAKSGRPNLELVIRPCEATDSETTQIDNIAWTGFVSSCKSFPATFRVNAPSFVLQPPELFDLHSLSSDVEPTSSDPAERGIRNES